LVVKKITGNVNKALNSIGVYLTSSIVKNIDSMGVVDTGRLKGSITHEVEGTEVKNGTNVEYALYQEFGTGIYAEEGQGRTTPWAYEGTDGKMHMTRGTKPRPFLRDAYRNGKEAVRRIAEKEMKLD
jgi:HK97 gp10 family phage protein